MLTLSGMYLYIIIYTVFSEDLAYVRLRDLHEWSQFLLQKLWDGCHHWPHSNDWETEARLQGSLGLKGIFKEEQFVWLPPWKHTIKYPRPSAILGIMRFANKISSIPGIKCLVSAFRKKLFTCENKEKGEFYCTLQCKSKMWSEDKKDRGWREPSHLPINRGFVSLVGNTATAAQLW